jgi:hypothetical protein
VKLAVSNILLQRGFSLKSLKRFETNLSKLEMKLTRGLALNRKKKSII